MRSVSKLYLCSAGKTASKRPSTTLRTRDRRQASLITIKDVRYEIIKQFKQLLSVTYCKSSEKVCPAGPPESLALKVQKDLEAGWDIKVPWDLLVNKGKQE